MALQDTSGPIKTSLHLRVQPVLLVPVILRLLERLLGEL